MLSFHRWFSRLAVVAALSALSNVGGWAQSRVECSAITSKILKAPVRYCAFLPPHYGTPPHVKTTPSPNPRRYPVLYYLHGLGDNEQSLVNSGGWNVVSELRNQGKVGDFIILAPSAGHSFYVNSANGKVRYEDFLMKEFIPLMEKKYRAEGTRATR